MLGLETSANVFESFLWLIYDFESSDIFLNKYVLANSKMAPIKTIGMLLKRMIRKY